MKIFGLIGQKLSHSFSKDYFTKKFLAESLPDCLYRNFELQDLSEIRSVWETSGLSGLNVTIPYKEQIIPYLDALDPLAEKVEAVNTIRFVGTKKVGYNTDVTGFCEAVRPLLSSKHTAALVLGTGGASKAVKEALADLGISVLSVSSSKGFGYADLGKKHYQEHLLIVNTSPLGMYPDVTSAPMLDYTQIGADHLLVDLVYNPTETLFLKKGKERGAQISNGLKMLQLQAEASWKIWND